MQNFNMLSPKEKRIVEKYRQNRAKKLQKQTYINKHQLQLPVSTPRPKLPKSTIKVYR